MAEDTKETYTNKNDEIWNIIQILLKYEKIYIGKLVAFVIILVTVYIDENNLNSISKQNFIGTFTFILSVTIDCIVLTQAIRSSIKGVINVIHLIFTFIMFLCFAFVLLIFMGEIDISSTIVFMCNRINILCCCSPILELGYDTILHMHNEITNKY